VAFVFGQKAYEAVMASKVHSSIKKDLEQATKFAEGRGIRIVVDQPEIIPAIELLIRVKLAN